MKKCFTVVLFSTLFSLLNISFAQSDYGCKKKENNLQIQLRYAEQHGNVQRAENLKRAILNIREYCGKNNYIEDQDLKLNDEVYRQNLTEKIAKQQSKIAEAEAELEKAKISGKPKKIREKTEKVQERQQKLEDYQQELKSLLDQ